RNVHADEKPLAFSEPGSGPSGATPKGDFCQPWRGQPAARWNRRATRPNAIRDSVINDSVDPVSATAPADSLVHCPGAEKFAPLSLKEIRPASRGSLFPSWTVNNVVLGEVATCTFHNIIAPVGPVANANEKSTEGVRFVNVWMPSENVKAVGDTLVSAMF